jgi:hypothetical protein
VPFGSATGTLIQNNPNFFWDNTNFRLGIGVASPTATLQIVQPIVNAAVPSALVLTGGAHTAITSANEDIGANFNFSSTKQWASGGIVLQREVLFQAPTYSFTSGSTITRAATVAITGAPLKGTNATLTNTDALLLQGTYSPSTSSMSINQLGILATFSPTAAASTFKGINLAYTINQTGGANGQVNGFLLNATETSVLGTHNLLNLQTGSTNRFTVGRFGSLSILQASIPTGSTGATVLTVLGGAHASLSASLEAIGVLFDFNAQTQTWATGNISVQREVLIRTPVYDAVGASTMSTAATFAIEGSPTNASNMAITFPLSLWVQSGTSRFDGGLQVFTRNITAGMSPYTVDPMTDFGLDISGTTAAAITINLPAGASVGNGRIFISTDSGYNCGTAGRNITLVRSGADKINNVSGNYTQNISGSSLMLKWNAVATNWEFI